MAEAADCPSNPLNPEAGSPSSPETGGLCSASGTDRKAASRCRISEEAFCSLTGRPDDAMRASVHGTSSGTTCPAGIFIEACTGAGSI